MKRVLILEDDADLRALLGAALGEHGIASAEAGSCAQAEQVLALGGIDLLIVDGLLPDESGIDFIARVRARDANLPVVFLSAFFRDLRTFKRLTGELNASLVVYKPVDAGLLAARIGELLTRPAGSGEPVRRRAGAQNSGSAAIGMALEELRRSFALRLPEKLGELERAVQRIGCDPTQLDATRTLAHRLRGTAGSYGFAAVGEAAGEIEDLLNAMDRTARLSPALPLARIGHALERAREAASLPADQPPGGSDPAVGAGQGTPRSEPGETTR